MRRITDPRFVGIEPILKRKPLRPPPERVRFAPHLDFREMRAELLIQPFPKRPASQRNFYGGISLCDPEAPGHFLKAIRPPGAEREQLDVG